MPRFCILTSSQAKPSFNTFPTTANAESRVWNSTHRAHHLPLLQEYVELETCYSEALSRNAVYNSEFGEWRSNCFEAFALIT